jgi:hypothetical protein
MPRWINIIKAPFDYRWPDRNAITAFTVTGDQLVKDEVADFAVGKGYAIEGKANATARSVKGGGKRVTRRRRRASAAKPRTSAPVGNANVADADRPAGGTLVAGDAGE